MDVYGDKEEIILTGVKEIEELIKEGIPQNRINNDLENDLPSITVIDEFITKLSP